MRISLLEYVKQCLIATITLLGLLCVPFSNGQQNEQQSIGLFDDQRLIYSSDLSSRVYLLALGSLNKIDGRWVSEREELVQAKVSRQTYEITHPYDLNSAWNAVQGYFTLTEASLVYECLGFECGSSNAWANERFGIKQLYGLDLSQKYQVWQWQTGETARVAVVYLVQRGNQRIYFHIDQLRPTTNNVSFVPSASAVAKEFYARRQINVSGLQFDNGNIIVNEEHIKALANALNEKPFLQLDVVGHDYYPGTDEEKRQRAISYAQQVIASLTKNGVRPKRMKALNLAEVSVKDQNENAKVVILLRSK